MKLLSNYSSSNQKKKNHIIQPLVKSFIRVAFPIAYLKVFAIFFFSFFLFFIQSSTLFRRGRIEIISFFTAMHKGQKKQCLLKGSLHYHV